MSSTLHQSGLIDFDNLNAEKGFYLQKRARNPGYCNSKLANAYFCEELARRTAETGLETYAVSKNHLSSVKVLTVLPVSLVSISSFISSINVAVS